MVRCRGSNDFYSAVPRHYIDDVGFVKRKISFSVARFISTNYWASSMEDGLQLLLGNIPSTTIGEATPALSAF
ncbi:MAG: hypothetical protein PVH33_03645 [Syntrophobacterales bacterium]|jgi:hypothetical protein